MAHESKQLLSSTTEYPLIQVQIQPATEYIVVVNMRVVASQFCFIRRLISVFLNNHGNNHDS